MISRYLCNCNLYSIFQLTVINIRKPVIRVACMVAYKVRTCNREVAGSSPVCSASRNDSGQVVHAQCASVHQAV